MSMTAYFNQALSFAVIAMPLVIASADCYAACSKVPLGGEKNAFFTAVAKQMTALHGIGMKQLVQGGDYAGTKFKMNWYRFGTEKEIQDGTGVQIEDDSPPGPIKALLLLGSNSEANLARMKTLTAVTISYFSKIDQSQIATKIEEMLNTIVAAEPTSVDVSKPGWKLSKDPVAKGQWNGVNAEMPALPRALNSVQVVVYKQVCK